MNKKMSRGIVLCIVFAMLLVNCMSVVAATPVVVETQAEGYVVMDADTGLVIMGKNQESKFYPASITKVMTALLVCENVADLDRVMTFSQAALNEMTVNSSHLPGKMAVVGEQMTVKSALYGMFICSANECAAQLGIEVAGSTAAFAALMTQRAAQLGCTMTNFTNAHGLHDNNHFTTPHDMAIIFNAAMKNERFAAMATTYRYEIPATNVHPMRDCIIGHKFLSGEISYPEAFAGKTGNTLEAGRTLITEAVFDGHKAICVVMKSNNEQFYNDTLKLLEYAKGYYAGDFEGMIWEPTDKIMQVKVDNNLAVRDYPCTKGTNIVGALYNGDKVTVTASWGKWKQINYGGVYCYVHSDFLVDVDSQEPSVTESAVPSPEQSESQTETVETQPDETVSEAPTEQPVPSETQSEGGVTVDPSLEHLIGLGTDASSDETTAANQSKNKLTNGPIMYILIAAVVLIAVIAIIGVLVFQSDKEFDDDDDYLDDEDLSDDELDDEDETEADDADEEIEEDESSDDDLEEEEFDVESEDEDE